MRTRAALLHGQPDRWSVEEVELDDPRETEVLVQMAAAGLCHSDDHFSTGDIKVPGLPFCGGHEGAGVVREIGSGVTSLAVGDHVVTSFVAACGSCRWCASGSQHLCDNGALIARGTKRDGTYRMHQNGADIPAAIGLGVFTQYQVLDQLSCIRVDASIPLDVASLVSCGVPTGWGSAVNAAAVRAGDVVVVLGSGGVGINAVQGALHCGAAEVVVIDPQPFKRSFAASLGAGSTFPAADDDAIEYIRSVTDGQGADSAIVTVGVVEQSHVADALRAIRKGGTVVVTGAGGPRADAIPCHVNELLSYAKRVQGCLYGNASPRAQIPQLLRLYRSGRLKLDELITQRYSLDAINQGYADMHAGTNIRGIIEFDHVH